MGIVLAGLPFMTSLSADERYSLRFWLSILALVYLAVISQWGGRFWYQAMTEAGVGRFSQIQLLQPFFTLFFAVVFLTEVLEIEHLIFAGLIALAVFTSLRAKS